MKRLLVGLVVGGLVGGLLAAAMVRLIGVEIWSGASGSSMLSHPVIAYVAAALTGTLVGLVTGKPIWAAGGKIEAGLKALFGALLGAGLLFVLRRWIPGELDLAALHAGSGKLGDLPAAALPFVGGVLGGFYGADNTDEPEAKADPKKRVRTESTRVAPSDEESEEVEAAPKRMKR